MLRWFLILGLWLRQGFIARFGRLWLIYWFGWLSWLVSRPGWWRWLIDLPLRRRLWLIDLFQYWWLLVNMNWRVSGIDDMRCWCRSGICWSAWLLVSRGLNRGWCIVSLLGRGFVARLRLINWLWWSISRLWWGI